MRRTIILDGKLINLDKIHFVRIESPTELLISFGTDFLRFRKDADTISEFFNRLQLASNEKFPSKNR